MLQVTFSQRTDVGMQRQENQDNVGHFEGPLGKLFVVCDGMGGHAGGQLASRVAVDTIGEVFSATAKNVTPSEALRIAIESANDAIFDRAVEEPALTGMGTTCVALLVDPDVTKVHVAHVGDSRIYRITDGEIERLTRDHTAVQHLIDQGLLTEAEAALHPRAHVINRSLGVLDAVEVELGAATIIPKSGERFLLCSDGLTSMAEDEDIYRYVAQYPVEDVSHELVELANARGGYDNVTVQVVLFGESTTLPSLDEGGPVIKRPPPPAMLAPPAAKEWNLPVIMVVATVSLITLLAIVFSVIS